MDVMEIKNKEEDGRGFYTTCFLKMGDCVLTDSPVGCVVINNPVEGSSSSKVSVLFFQI